MRYYDEFTYVSVAQRRIRAEKQLRKLRKSGRTIHPVAATNARGKMAKTFWGKAWCEHLEKFSDYRNRLPRGRSYVRNGAVLHLGVNAGAIEALVQGTRCYEQKLAVEPLAAARWNAIKQQCQGKIDSLIELLQGRVAGEIMHIVTDRDTGLFPRPQEMAFQCSCPDWAGMCKHVAAALYGVGLRLDEEPELLFTLRGVDVNELTSMDAAAAEISSGRKTSRRRRMRHGTAAGIFGVEAPGDLPESIDFGSAPATAARKKSLKKSSRTSAASTAPKPGGKAGKKAAITAAKVRRLRKRLRLSKAAFARQAGVTPATVAKWENSSGALRLQARTLHALETLAGKAAGD